MTTDTVPLVRNVSPRLQTPQGTFVTLRKHGELRGCIGHIPPDYPLARAVGAMALHAAFSDTRFPQLARSELEEVDIEISVLTSTKPITGPQEIVVGRDGVVISKNGKTAVFLPQVAAEQKWGRTELLENLCLKAGLARDSWKEGARFSVFQAIAFDEAQFR
jgi:AmmeMemoRadiSam system protein A